MRDILVFNTLTNSATELRQTPVENWGQLKDVVTGKGIYKDGMKAMIRENKLSLDHNDAVLPTGLGRDRNNAPNGFDFTLFLLPSKVKSGSNDEVVEILNNFEEEIEESISELREKLIAKIDLLAKSTLNPDQQSLFEEAKRLRREMEGFDD